MKANSYGPPAQGQQVALKTLVAGGMLIRAAEGEGDPERDSEVGNLWLCGLVLVVIGAIWVGRTAWMLPPSIPVNDQ